MITFKGGIVYGIDGNGVSASNPAAFYETSTPDGEHLSFNGGTRYCLYHQLGRRPFSVEPWVSFSRYGTAQGNEAKPAGNMVEVLLVTDQVIVLRNDTCAEYYLRLIASDPVSSVATSSNPAPTVPKTTTGTTGPCGE